MKMKRVKELENKIKTLEHQLSQEKQLNEFLCQFLEDEKDLPIIFSEVTILDTIDWRYKCGTEITYLYQGKLHSFTMQYLGKSADIRIIRNSKHIFIFKDAGGDSWIVDKDQKTAINLPSDILLASDLESLDIKLGTGTFKIGSIKENQFV